jgi:hypothetical protein
VGEAFGRLSQGPDDVQPPHDERSCDADGLQNVSREVGSAGVELAPLAGAYDLAGIRDCDGPVKALAERVAYEGAGRGVVAADACVNVPEEPAPLGDGHALLQDAGMSHPVLKAKPNALITCAPGSSYTHA